MLCQVFCIHDVTKKRATKNVNLCGILKKQRLKNYIIEFIRLEVKIKKNISSCFCVSKSYIIFVLIPIHAAKKITTYLLGAEPVQK